ncbi:transcription factor bHLH91-like [Bidens hawaiensis]|uniref:transcription factor bHLH91-like n=1 Tax=Bidens hawaiensis TaxID=980011 RepID=UPI00404B3F26
MLDNPDMFESSACFDPNTATHHHQLLINHLQIPNFTAIEPPADHNHHQQHLMNIEVDHQVNWNQMGITQTPPDLLNLFQLPKCASSICFSNPTQIENSGQVLYDPGLPQPPLFRELLNSLPNGFNLTGFGEMFNNNNNNNNMERGEQSRLFDAGDGVLEFGAGIININGKGINNNKDMKHFATEKHRRQQMGGKFEALKQLIPNPSKADRASIVGDGIEYINELKRTVEELKILVDRKRCNRGRMKKHKAEDHLTLDVESIYTRSNGNGGDTGHDQQGYNGNSTSTMRSSWLQRKSKNIEIDVRIIDDEVTIKLVQQ